MSVMVNPGRLSSFVFQFDLNVVPGEYFISLGVALDDSEHDNIAIDRR